MGLLRQTAFVLSWDMAAKALTALTMILIIRLLDPLEYASYTLAIAVAGVVVQVLSSAVTRIYVLSYDQLGIAEHPGALLSIELALGLAVPLAVIPVCGVGLPLGLAVCGLVVSRLASEFVRTEFQRRLAFGGYANLELFRSALFLGAIAMLAPLGIAEPGAGLVTSAQALAVAVVTVPFVVRLSLTKGITRFRAGVSTGKQLLSPENRYLFGYFCVLAVFVQLDVFMLKALSDSQNVASYGSASRYYGVLGMALGAVHAVLLPAVAQSRTRLEIEQLFAKQRIAVVIFAMGVITLVLAAPSLIPLIDKGRYPESIPVFQVLAVSSIISFAFSPHANVVMRIDRHRFLFYLICVGTGINLVLNFVLIPAHGALGAAFTTLASATVVNVSTYVRSRRLLASSEHVLAAK
ncbi:MAG: polysaccharide biosynthesis C-terminal domain-containing protein [Thermodesulfobacteriota bacterium]